MRCFFVGFVGFVAIVIASICIFIFSPDDLPPHVRVRGDFQCIGSAVIAYKIENGFYPSTEQGLRALVEKPSIEPIPRGWRKIADHIPMDPWNREYEYRLHEHESSSRFELWSLGRDGKPGTKDDLSSFTLNPPNEIETVKLAADHAKPLPATGGDHRLNPNRSAPSATFASAVRSITPSMTPTPGVETSRASESAKGASYTSPGCKAREKDEAKSRGLKARSIGLHPLECPAR